LGVIHSGDAALELGRRALRVKLTGIVLEGEFEHEIADRIRGEAGGKLTVIELPSRGRMRLDSNDPIVGTSQALWPGIEIQHGGTVSTGPQARLGSIRTPASSVLFARDEGGGVAR